MCAWCRCHERNVHGSTLRGGSGGVLRSPPIMLKCQSPVVFAVPHAVPSARGPGVDLVLSWNASMIGT